MLKQFVINSQLDKFSSVVKPKSPCDSPYLVVHGASGLIQLVGDLIDAITLRVEFDHFVLGLAENSLAFRPADYILVTAYPVQWAFDLFEVEKPFLYVEFLEVVRAHVATDEPVNDLVIHHPLVEGEVFEYLLQPIVCFREKSNDVISYQLNNVIVFGGEHPAFFPLSEPHVTVSSDKKLYIFHKSSLITLVIASISSWFILLLAFNFDIIVA